MIIRFGSTRRLELLFNICSKRLLDLEQVLFRCQDHLAMFLHVWVMASVTSPVVCVFTCALITPSLSRRSQLCTWCCGSEAAPRKGRRSPTPLPKRTSTKGRRSSSPCSNTTRYGWTAGSRTGFCPPASVLTPLSFCRWTRTGKSTGWGASVPLTSAAPACSWRATSTGITAGSAPWRTASTNPRTSRQWGRSQ